jgi:putative membrane protein
VDEWDLGYLAMFAVGMVLGVILLVKVLQWLLAHHHRITMVVLAGVMLGALRTLWPWQDEARGLLAPTGDSRELVVLAAAHLGATRLLDNIEVDTPAP